MMLVIMRTSLMSSIYTLLCIRLILKKYVKLNFMFPNGSKAGSESHIITTTYTIQFRLYSFVFYLCYYIIKSFCMENKIVKYFLYPSYIYETRGNVLKEVTSNNHKAFSPGMYPIKPKC